ncbi:MAG TPA: helix-turn-helix domain-containing protein, partial [Candidatus Dojkabacteria bacterium]
MQKVFYANQNLGSLLRQKRLEHGVSLKQAAESTKIREEYIVALENSDYKTLPASVYTKGFIKNYSAFLGINSKMTLALFRRESETE